jgi:hypothetical protein
MVVKIWMLVFWVVMPCGLVGRYNLLDEHTASIFRTEYGGSMPLQNVGNYLQVHMVTIQKNNMDNLLMSP